MSYWNSTLIRADLEPRTGLGAGQKTGLRAIHLADHLWRTISEVEMGPRVGRQMAGTQRIRGILSRVFATF